MWRVIKITETKFMLLILILKYEIKQKKQLNSDKELCTWCLDV